jgi:predicted ribosomally synthesized peptide with nif11-like leader
MSEEQLSALIARLSYDAELKEKLQGATNLNAAQAIAKEAGFDVSKADWIVFKHGIPRSQVMGLSDAELEAVAGGKGQCNVSCVMGSYSDE